MDIPKAHVVEQDGETSCSVEETNRIRAQLGLKPLATDTSSTKGKETVVAPVLDTTVREPPRKKARNVQGLEEEQLHISHNLEELEDHLHEGIILTLKDKSIISKQTGDVDTSEDELENIQLAEADHRKRKVDDASKGKYDPLGDVEMGPDQQWRPKDALSHYDDWAEGARKPKLDSGLRVRASGWGGVVSSNTGAAEILADESLAPEERLKRLIEQGQKNVSLGATYNSKQISGEDAFRVSTAPQNVSDFYTETEMMSFKRREVKKKKKASKNKLKPEEEDLEMPKDNKLDWSYLDNAEEEQLDVPGLTLRKDVGKAKDGQQVQDDAEEDLSAKLLPPSVEDILRAARPKRDKTDVMIIDSFNRLNGDTSRVENLPADISKTISEIVPQTDGDHAEGSATVDLGGLKLVKEEDGKEAVFQAEKEKKVVEVGSLELTTSTEFCRLVATPAEKRAEHQTASDETSGFDTAASSRRSVVQPDGTMVEEEDDDDEEAVTAESTLGTGVSVALQRLKARGELSERVTSRVNKERHTPLQKEAGDDVLLDYRDDYGRVMGPKEAFNYLSYKFHGRGPGLRKLEKLKRRALLDQQSKFGTVKEMMIDPKKSKGGK